MSDTDNGGEGIQPDSTTPRDDEGTERPEGGTPDGGAAEHQEAEPDLAQDPGAPTTETTTTAPDGTTTETVVSDPAGGADGGGSGDAKAAPSGD